MKFMGENFMIPSKTGRELYFDYAEKMPIFDYHCHLDPAQIAENKHFQNITELWLYGDHYKWRAMRSCGVDEKYITDPATPDKERFLAYAKIMPMLIGNPLYHWTHLELSRCFGIDEQLSEKSAEDIWKRANKVIASDDFCVNKILKKFKVKVLCTTDDPIDDLANHKAIAEKGKCPAQVLPAFRPDKALHIQKEGFAAYVGELGRVCGYEIKNVEDLLRALKERMEYFHQAGCRISDHGLDDVVYRDASMEEANSAFTAVMGGAAPTKEQEAAFKTVVLTSLAKQYKTYGWTMQLHMNVLRNNNGRMLRRLGVDTGFDSVNDGQLALPLSRLLNGMEEADALPKTILYTLNPADNYVLGSMLGNFQSSEARSKIQFGSGWWFCDQKEGMREQMKTLANLGVLSCFVGMLTDSRSFLSYPRHEYFRRILCNLLGEWVDGGEYPDDRESLEKIIKGICYNNAVEYFGIGKKVK